MSRQEREGEIERDGEGGRESRRERDRERERERERERARSQKTDDCVLQIQDFYGRKKCTHTRAQKTHTY